LGRKVVFSGAEVSMPDIFFKCGSCGKHLVADDAGAGQTINCPDCDAVLAVPENVFVRECLLCKTSVQFSDDMKGEIISCPFCQKRFSLSGGEPVNLAR
jgi:DNA-directed RNA polymerase subunit RPC12/RpoP